MATNRITCELYGTLSIRFSSPHIPAFTTLFSGLSRCLWLINVERAMWLTLRISYYDILAIVPADSLDLVTGLTSSLFSHLWTTYLSTILFCSLHFGVCLCHKFRVLAPTFSHKNIYRRKHLHCYWSVTPIYPRDWHNPISTMASASQVHLSPDHAGIFHMPEIQLESAKVGSRVLQE